MSDSSMGAPGESLRQQARQKVFGLYVIIDPQVTGGRDPLKVAQAALKGGARILQLRDKCRDNIETLPLARELATLCHHHQALFIINDHAHLAMVVDADGLHVGQKDLPVTEARDVLKPSQIVGQSNAVLEEAIEAQAQGADYIAVGSIFATTTKERTRLAGLDTLRKVKQVVSRPVVAIGGITEENMTKVVRSGADAVCVTSAVGMAKSPLAAAERLVEKIRQAGGKA